jgi:DNA (cytosine-5)-methyltransferase 1
LKRFRVVDLFCGCGGMSRGFQRTGRYDVEYGVELEKHPAATFEMNIRNSLGNPARVYQGDILDLLKSKASLWEELNAAGITAPGQIDVLMGGPPCQGFSRNGVRKYGDEGRRFYDDPRNHLYKAFLDMLDALRPKIVLIENVREFLNYGGGKFSRDLLQRLDELGYTADYRKVCAADYGVPQIRHRVFFVAVSREFANLDVDQLPFPAPKFQKVGGQASLFDRMSYRTVRDAIWDLPSPTYEHGVAIPYDNRKRVGDFAEEMRSASGEVTSHVARELSAKTRERVKAVGTGRMKHIDDSLKTKKFYGSAYRRLSWDEPSLTITTWVYHVGSGRFAHPVEDRGITMREAARLQSFDDDFRFPDLINPVSQMIGNAVPPTVAQCFAEAFLQLLDGRVKSSKAHSSRSSTARSKTFA